MTIGGLGASGYMPIRAITSAKFRPAARTSTMTSPSAACGSGRSWTCRTDGSPWEVVTTARMSVAQQRRVGLLGLALPERAGQQRAREEHRQHAGEQAPDADPHRCADAQRARRAVLGNAAVAV